MLNISGRVVNLVWLLLKTAVAKVLKQTLA